MINTIMYALPAYIKVAILLRSSGGAHFASMAAIEGYVTACEHTKSVRTKQGSGKSWGKSPVSPLIYVSEHHFNVSSCVFPAQFQTKFSIFSWGSMPSTPQVVFTHFRRSHVSIARPKAAFPTSTSRTRPWFERNKAEIYRLTEQIWLDNNNTQCSLLARLMGQYCFARWRLSSSVVCRRL